MFQQVNRICNSNSRLSLRYMATFKYPQRLPISIPNISSKHSTNVLTQSLVVAKYLHSLYERNFKLNNDRIMNNEEKVYSENYYHKQFVRGVQPYANQTNGCLILEGYYGTPFSMIHTPIGSWTICGSGESFNLELSNGLHIDSDSVLMSEFLKKVKCDLICPSYQDDNGKLFGPYWLVRSINGLTFSHPKITLLQPPSFEPKKSCTILFSQPKRSIIAPKKKNDVMKYYRQLQSFYKFDKNAYNAYNAQLKIWIEEGYISDIEGYSRLMIKSDNGFDRYKDFFLKDIDTKLHKDILSDKKSKEQIIFELIYLSKNNNNSY